MTDFLGHAALYVVGTIVTFTCRDRPDTGGPGRAKTSREDVRFVHPIDESDPFCTCPNPRCGLLGTHAVEVRQQTRDANGRPSIPTMNVITDGPVVVVHAVNVAPGTWCAVRTCWSCGHKWTTKAATPPSPVDIHDPVTTCPQCGLFAGHFIEVKQLDAAKPFTFLGKPTGDWTVSGPDGLTVAIHKCRGCNRMWHTADGETSA